MLICGDFWLDLDDKEQICRKAFLAENYRICTFNPEMLIASLQDESLAKAIKQADSIIPDGIGLVLLLKKLGVKQAQRLPGIELAWYLIEYAVKRQCKIALIGSTQVALEGTIAKIRQECGSFNLVYARNGFFKEKEEEQVYQELKKLAPDLTLLALPFRKQEKILAKYQIKGIYLGVGGSFEVWADLVRRAPFIWQQLGFEWLWRLYKQPARLNRLAKTIWPFWKIYWQA